MSLILSITLSLLFQTQVWAFETPALKNPLDSSPHDKGEQAGESGNPHAPPLPREPVSLPGVDHSGHEGNLRPAQGIMPLSGPRSDSMSSIGFYIVPAGILCLLLWFWARKRLRSMKREGVLSPLAHGLKKVQELETLRLFEKGMVTEYYQALSEILRTSLEEAKGIPLRCTTEEMVRYLDEREDHRLLALLKNADMVKFAKAVPDRSQKEEDLGNILAFFKETPMPCRHNER